MNADCCGEKFYTHYASQVLYFYIFSYKSADVWWDAHQWIELLLSCNLSGITCCCVLVEVSWPSVTVIGIYEFTSDLPAQWLTDEREGRRGTQVEVVLLSHVSSTGLPLRVETQPIFRTWENTLTSPWVFLPSPQHLHKCSGFFMQWCVEWTRFDLPNIPVVVLTKENLYM